VPANDWVRTVVPHIVTHVVWARSGTNMKILSTCPFCGKGKIKATRAKIGEAVSCPKCFKDFLFSDPADEVARAVAEDLARSSAKANEVDHPFPATSGPVAITLPRPTPRADVGSRWWDGDPGWLWAIFAAGCAGLAFLGTLFPYGPG
jgi:predicted  nucleic acid-binding Zn-ribbon protein